MERRISSPEALATGTIVVRAVTADAVFSRWNRIIAALQIEELSTTQGQIRSARIKALSAANELLSLEGDNLGRCIFLAHRHLAQDNEVLAGRALDTMVGTGLIDREGINKMLGSNLR
ncbi:MAG: hypothetical protein Q7K55_00105 [Candidatus Levybacteria bacterium]|nr:hypothetical protein [Candidatus Levybacteria bacterium]